MTNAFVYCWLRQTLNSEKERKQKYGSHHLGKPSWNKGIPMSETTRKKLSQANLGKTHTEETKQKCRSYRHTLETKQKMSITRTGKISPIKGTYWSSAQKERHSERTKSWWKERKNII